MPKCPRIFNLFGMKHLQALMLGFVSAIDVVNVLAVGLLAYQKRTKPRGNVPEERIWETEINMVARYSYLAVGLGRMLIALFILRVNNKYILLVFAVIEIVVFLIGHALYIQEGLEALQYTFLVLLFVQGARWPLAMNIISKWSTTNTLTFMMWTFKGSLALFSTFFYHIIDALKEYGILSMCMYLSVVVKGTFCVVWIIFGSGDPIHNIFISREELLELRDEHRLRLKTHWKQSAPVKKMLTTPILYGCLIFHCANVWMNTWNNNAFIHPFARYRQGKWLPLVGYYLRIFAEGVIALCIDYAIKKNKTTLNNIRKTCAAISAWGSGSCFLLIGANLGKPASTMAFQILNHVFYTCNGSYGALLIMHAVSPNYFGFTHCILSSAAHLTLGLRPIFDKSLAADAATDPTKAMSFLLYYYGFLLYFSCLLLLLAGNCRRRDYDSLNTVPWKEDSIVSFP